VSEDEKWALNPGSFKKGYIGWKGGRVVGEHMQPQWSNNVIDQSTFDHIDETSETDGWKEQHSVELKSLEDGVEVIFKTMSVGGKNAMGKLWSAVGAQMKENPQRPVPIVTLSSESYPHSQYGKIFNPIFSIEDWVDENLKKPRKKAVPPKDRPALV